MMIISAIILRKMIFLSQTLDEDENIWSLHDKSEVTLNEYL